MRKRLERETAKERQEDEKKEEEECKEKGIST